MTSSEIAANGWAAVPVDAGKIFRNGPYINEPEYIDVQSIQFPDGDPIVKKTQEHAKDKLLKQTYSHSMRVYYWCKSMAASVELSFVY
jgi:cyanamide hydratase